MNSCTRSIRAAKAPRPGTEADPQHHDEEATRPLVGGHPGRVIADRDAAQHGARPGIQHADGAGREVLATVVDAVGVKRKDVPAMCIHEHSLWPKADHGHRRA
jgi:hypothetical protein